MAKPTLTDRITAAIQADNAQQEVIRRGEGPQPVPARSYNTGTDSYETTIGFNSDLLHSSPGSARGMWQVYEQQQAHIPVTNLTSSGNTSSNLPGAIQGGLTQNPKAIATTWAAVPQMILPVRAQGPVQIVANVSVNSSTANDTAGFAIYRDGNLIGNHVTHTMPATASASTLVQLATIDSPTTGQHIYAMYWSPGAGTLVATSNQRNIYVINLTPQ